MEYDNWNLDVLKKQLNNFQEGDESYLLLEDLIEIQRLKDVDLSAFDLDDESFIDQLDKSKMILNKYYEFMPFIDKFSKYIIKPYLDNPDIVIEPSRDEVLSFTHDFYHDLSPVFYKKFMNFYSQRKDCVRFSDNRSASFYITSLNYSYIDLQETYCIDEFYAAVHEFGHGIANTFAVTNYESSIFVELLPIFMEFLVSDKLISYYDDKDIKDYVALNDYNELAVHSTYAKELTFFNEGLHVTSSYMRRKQLLNALCKISNDTKKKTKKMFDITLDERFCYLIPYLVAMELYYKYKDDPEKTLYTLENIIQLKDNFYTSLIKNDILLNEHSSEYVDKIKRENANVRRKLPTNY
ncbi:MAG TPA: hypothetical protein PLB45_00665 [Bacilli bacterium]|nr:hypothetical protein [Bacilli bacterium]HPZ23426.1 hypothetical protein [Bacilli bacterium]HQC83372.1 hypothetical protein [Bacilli bacterium]